MRTSISQPIPLRVQRQTRLLIAATALAGLAAATVLWLVTSSHSGPLLLTLDEMKVEHRAVPSAPRTLPVHLPIPAAAPVAEEPSKSSIVDELASGEEIRWFNGRPIRPARTMSMIVTAYSPDERSCGDFADGITASGLSVYTNGMKLAAADTRVLPFGSMISVPGYDEGRVIPVLDRGGAIKGNRLDLLYPTHETARRWGVQRLEVTVWEYADGQPNGFVPRFNRASAVQD